MPNNETLITVLERIAIKLEQRSRRSEPAGAPAEPPQPPAAARPAPAAPAPASSGPTTAAPSPATPAPDSATPLCAKNVSVHGSNLHYVEAGPADAPVVLFLHGNPTSSYLWRNIMPALAGQARVIALDLIGMGKSDKPRINYRLLDHYKYLEGFIDQLGLRNLTLVVHDWGSALGFHYMKMHPGNVKAIAFLEALLRPYPSWDAFPRPGAAAQFAQVFQSFRGDAGRAVLIDNDTNFINLLLLPVMGVDLSMEDLDRYWAPLANKEDREPVWRWTNEIPVADDPPDVASLVEDYSRALCESSVPKLLIYHPNGVIVNESEAEWCRNNLKNFQCVKIDTPLAAPIHFLQERFPEEVGQALARWHEKL